MNCAVNSFTWASAPRKPRSRAISASSASSRPPKATAPSRPPLPRKRLPWPPSSRAVKEFLLDMRPAQNMLVLKTPPGGAQPLAAAVDAEHWKEVAGTLAGDDTVLVIAASRAGCNAVRKRLEELLR